MSRILMILTSHDQLGDTGRKTGFWLEEFASPYYVFTDAGHEVTLASPRGGQPPIDPTSSQPEMQTDATRRFDQDEEAKAALFTDSGAYADFSYADDSSLGEFQAIPLEDYDFGAN